MLGHLRLGSLAPASFRLAFFGACFLPFGVLPESFAVYGRRFLGAGAGFLVRVFL